MRPGYGSRMALTVDRVNERIEHDLSDLEITRMILAAVTEIEQRFGPVADPDAPITVVLSGTRRRLDLIRPADVAYDVDISETPRGGDPVVVDAGDWIVKNGGRTLERLTTPDWSVRAEWAHSVAVTYVPIDDAPVRDEVALGLVQLAVERHGVKRRKAGDLETETADYATEREQLLATLAPRRGLFVR